MPAWAPDGQSLYVSSDRDGDYDIWQVPLDAPELARNLIDDADNPRDDSMPDAYWPRL
jgi:Tol biopolymer transport system component